MSKETIFFIVIFGIMAIADAAFIIAMVIKHNEDGKDL